MKGPWALSFFLHGLESTLFTHVEPTQATGSPRHTVQSCSAQAGRFLRGAPGRAAALRRPQLLQPCEKTARCRLNTPASQTGGPIFLSRRQCPRRLPKNQGYKASPRSALSADGEANKGTRSADPPSPNRRSRPGLAQRPARHGRTQRPRKSGSPAGTRRHRGLCLGAGRRRPRATTPCRSACPPIAHGPPKFGSKNFVLFSQDNVTFDSTPPFSPFGGRATALLA